MSSTSDPSKEAEQKISRALQLRTLLGTLPGLRGALRGMDASLVQTIGRILDDDSLDDIHQAVDDTINVDAVAALQKGSLAAKFVPLDRFYLNL